MRCHPGSLHRNERDAGYDEAADLDIRLRAVRGDSGPSE